jgi:hypothetical protein
LPPINYFEVVVGEPAPLLLGSALELLRFQSMTYSCPSR